MPRPASNFPTELELSLLKLLWEEAPLPVREIRSRLANAGRDIAHTSVITTLNTMVDKGFLKRTKVRNAFLFAPRVKRDEVSRGMLVDLVDKVFDGSASAVILSLFDSSKIDRDELEELRCLFEQNVKEQEQ